MPSSSSIAWKSRMPAAINQRTLAPVSLSASCPGAGRRRGRSAPLVRPPAAAVARAPGWVLASLKWATAKVERTSQRGNGDRAQGWEREAERGGDFNDTQRNHSDLRRYPCPRCRPGARFVTGYLSAGMYALLISDQEGVSTFIGSRACDSLGPAGGGGPSAFQRSLAFKSQATPNAQTEITSAR